MFNEFRIDFGVDSVRENKKSKTPTKDEKPLWEEVVVPQLEIVKDN